VRGDPLGEVAFDLPFRTEPVENSGSKLGEGLRILIEEQPVGAEAMLYRVFRDDEVDLAAI